MKKRIKKKINKRIMNNIKKGKPLSEFDDKYFNYTFKPAFKKFEKRIDKSFILGEDNRKPVGLLSESSNVARHPSKWQKVKSKMKGWFGK